VFFNGSILDEGQKIGDDCFGLGWRRQFWMMGSEGFAPGSCGMDRRRRG
jgi:hypothetical protein